MCYTDLPKPVVLLCYTFVCTVNTKTTAPLKDPMFNFWQLIADRPDKFVTILYIITMPHGCQLSITLLHITTQPNELLHYASHFCIHTTQCTATLCVQPNVLLHYATHFCICRHQCTLCYTRHCCICRHLMYCYVLSACFLYLQTPMYCQPPLYLQKP